MVTNIEIREFYMEDNYKCNTFNNDFKVDFMFNHLSLSKTLNKQ